MKYLALLILGIGICLQQELMAQSLSKHQWKDRLLIIKTNDLADSLYTKQIAALKKNLDELEERKLVVYKVHKGKYQTDLGTKKNWTKIDSSLIRDDFKIITENFEITLIGLDGQVKLRQNTFLEPNQLFGRIDSMPMRRQEIKNKSNQ
ncbi:DUF4174 domain-containing protein [Echinicola salinicaeni]|uniref:DUF4174 domain-containing protein n=1 Tax=Echinicola salinicaeni TaxID=2762757 RepID=UPI001648E749|nr:DUF4174 domain-containing protein [Echinicola salinicaeni]